MTITEMLKTELIPVYFTFDELLHVVQCLDIVSSLPDSDAESLHESVFGNLTEKLNHEQDMRVIESQRYHDAYVDRLNNLTDAFSYKSSNYTSRYAS